MTTTAAPKERRHRTVGWRSRDVVRTAALVIALYLAVRLVWFTNALLLTAFLGVLFGLAVGAGVDQLRRFRIPRGLAAAAIVLAFFGLLFGVGAWITPTLRQQSAELRVKIPEAVDRIQEWIGKRKAGLLGVMVGDSTAKRQGTADSTTTAPPDSTPASPDTSTRTASDTTGATPAPGADQTLREHLGSQLTGVTRYLFPFLSHTFAVVAGIFLIIFMAIYIATDPDLYHRGLMQLFPHRARLRAGEVLSAMAVVLRRWLVTQLFAMLTIGVVTTLALAILHVKAAVALGVIAGLLEFIPTIGPTLSAAPAIAMGFLDSPEKALTVLAVYVGIQFFENHLLIPLLMKGGLDAPPVLTILAQALMTVLFGFIGLMVAVPMLAAVMVAVKMLYVHDVVGDNVPVVDAQPNTLIPVARK
jgi:predicted PurR-regulated permease PerM